MSLGSFAASLSGLHANQQKLSVIGNNLANINTVAFKSSNVAFADLVSQSIGGSGANPMQIGLGVSVGEINPIFSQGGIDTRDVSYLVLFTATFLSFTFFALDARRWRGVRS